MSVHETPLTVRYWQSLGEGTLYEEFPVVKRRRGVQERRAVDGLVVLGTPPHHVPADHAGAAERHAASLDGKDVVVIQTRATPLNPYLFGQALLGLDPLPDCAALAAQRLGGFAIAPAWVGSSVRIAGVLIAGHHETSVSLLKAVPGRDVVSVHSDFSERRFARIGMWVGGEVIMAQALLAQMGAASVRSVIVAHVGDAAIETALARHVNFEVHQP